MRISIITRHAPNNYGSLLQAIATEKAITKLGHSAEIVDYIRDDEFGLKGLLTLLSRKKAWNNNLFKKWLYIALRYPGDRLAQAKFSAMRKQFLHLSKRYHSLHELEVSSPRADIYMTGSDQVWGPITTGYYDKAYFLSYVSKAAKKIAYAGSFGRTDFTPTTLHEYSLMLKRYDAIAVREDSAVSLLAMMDVPCAGQVLDPTLLLDNKEWSTYIKNNITGKYVLVYQIHNNPILDQYAINFAKHVGLPLYRVSPSLHQLTRGGKLIYLPEVGEFLSYIKNATYIVTDSFHGTAFSINFNKQFIEILPNTKTGSRNQSILQLTGLQDRIVTDYNDFSISNKLIDYNSVNEILEVERKKSYAILRKLIEE